MVARIFSVFSLLVVISCNGFSQSQPDAPFARKGLIKANSTFGFGKLIQDEIFNTHLVSELEYFLEDPISLKGENILFLNHINNSDLLRFSGITSFGPMFHKTNGNWDFHLGMMAGVALTKPRGEDFNLKVNPTVSLQTGVTYYVWDYFNFFTQLRYVQNAYRGYINGSLPLNEVIIITGLGFQLHTLKK